MDLLNGESIQECIERHIVELNHDISGSKAELKRAEDNGDLTTANYWRIMVEIFSEALCKLESVKKEWAVYTKI